MTSRLSLSLAVASAVFALPVQAAQPMPDATTERAPVQFAWALEPTQALTAPAPFTALSRSYWDTVDAASLQRGLELPLTAPDAVIQVSPVQGARALEVEQLQVRDPNGAQALDTVVDTQQLRAAGMGVNEGSAMARTGASTAVGSYRLQAPQAQGRYVVQVLEPNSPIALQLQADRQQVLAGGRVALTARLQNDGGSAALAAGRSVARVLPAAGEALLVAPDGRSWPVPLVAGKDGLRAQVTIPEDIGQAQGLWELQAFVTAQGVQRDAKVAFSVARPTARFSGQAAADAAQRQVRLPLRIGAPGRYEARGTLYATGPGGTLRPVAQAHSAAWFESAGAGELTLAFDSVALPGGYAAPFELRDLQLLDQGRMAPIETRAVAVRF
ncbi:MULTISPECIES: DUF4785 domain-containing protein [Stenotrophomonas]|uniref:DUF4785 domain-containing protein n=1 Tax=Stenotrophomonas TaxID=40323 RepID=UPI0008725817|nr:MULTISPECIES: DUF4785 domain-containing protein [Stenotrophomonas]OEY99416.1 DUF4785 domain-containing protein [Stenotrophomonas sp. BIIR7]